MEFWVSASPDIMGSAENMLARLKYINDITGVVPTPWKYIKIPACGFVFMGCHTDDGINGLYVTAHNYEVIEISKTNIATKLDFIAANTCVYTEGYDTDMLRLLREKNNNIVLWYAKQEMELMTNYVVRNTNILKDVGNFGFMTSQSDRLMFRNRKNGFEVALQLSFDKVSGVYRR